PKAAAGNDLGALHKLTAARAAAAAKGEGERLDARARYEALRALDTFAWRLLAEAAGDTLDLEALTELQVAWQSPAVAKAVEQHPLIALRAAWAIAEAARALPKEAELAALAKTARAHTGQAATKALDGLKKAPNNPTAFLTAAYAALARRDDAEFTAQATPLLTATKGEHPRLAAPRAAVTVLLAPRGEADGRTLATLVREQAQHIRGNDAVILTALACRRVGGEAWRVFRANARDLVGRQPLDGGVVVLINRLGTAPLPILASAR
ncbi:MAG: hypothetical protein ACODAJ_15060, partial [Planctomycetota bacterium]